MMKPAAGTAAPEAITPFMKARREVGLRAKPVRTPTAETASVADPSLSDMAVSPYARQAVTRLSRRSREHRSAVAEVRRRSLRVLSHGPRGCTRAVEPVELYLTKLLEAEPVLVAVCAELDLTDRQLHLTGRLATATGNSVVRIPTIFGRSSSLLDNDLPVHPRVRRADVEVRAGLFEGDRLRFALVQNAGIPVADLAFIERRGRVRNVADIGEGQRRARLDPSTGRPIGIFDIVVADLDVVHPLGDRAAGSSNGRRRWRRP